jgi:hypothetical protein
MWSPLEWSMDRRLASQTGQQGTSARASSSVGIRLFFKLRGSRSLNGRG